MTHPGDLLQFRGGVIETIEVVSCAAVLSDGSHEKYESVEVETSVDAESPYELELFVSCGATNPHSDNCTRLLSAEQEV